MQQKRSDFFRLKSQPVTCSPLAVGQTRLSFLQLPYMKHMRLARFVSYVSKSKDTVLEQACYSVGVTSLSAMCLVPSANPGASA